MTIAESSTLLRQIEYQVKKQENLIRKGEIKNVEQIWNKNQEISTRGISSEVRRIDNEWNNRGENIMQELKNEYYDLVDINTKLASMKLRKF